LREYLTFTPQTIRVRALTDGKDTPGSVGIDLFITQGDENDDPFAGRHHHHPPWNPIFRPGSSTGGMGNRWSCGAGGSWFRVEQVSGD